MLYELFGCLSHRQEDQSTLRVIRREDVFEKKIMENNKLLLLRSNYQIVLFMHIQVDVGGSLLSKTRKPVPDIISHSKIFLPFQHFLTPECRSTTLYQPMLWNKMFRTAKLHQNEFYWLISVRNAGNLQVLLSNNGLLSFFSQLKFANLKNLFNSQILY